MINEATRTIEDSQTAQALHGLLSLKSPDTSAGNNFPALLRAVGQHIKPTDIATPDGKTPQIYQMPDGMMYEVSEVPAPLTTIMLPTTKMAMRTDVKVCASPVVVAQPASGSMVKLLLQMQSQADAAANAKKKSASSGVETFQTIAAAPQTLAISPVSTQVLGRSFTRVVSPVGGNQPIILQHSKLANSNCSPVPVPIQFVGVAPSSPILQLIPQAGNMFISPSLIQSPPNGQPVIIPSLVATTATNLQMPPGRLVKQSSPRKRQPSVVSQATTNTVIAPPLKIQKMHDSGDISRTVMTMLQARSSVLPCKSNSCVSSKPSSELAAVIMPMLQHVKTDPTSDALEFPEVEKQTSVILRGFREIFEDIASLREDLKQQSNGVDSIAAGRTKPVVTRVIAQQINTPVAGSSNEQVNCRVR